MCQRFFRIQLYMCYAFWNKMRADFIGKSQEIRGLSLLITTQPPVRPNQRHRKRQKDAISGSALEKKSDDSAKATLVKTRRKNLKKSASALARDKARQRAYWERKRASNREARINANPLIIAEKCQSITSVISTTEANTLESSASKSQTVKHQQTVMHTRRAFKPLQF